MNFCQIESNRNYKYLSFNQYKYHICSLNKIIIQNKFYSNFTKMKFVDWGPAFINIFKIDLLTDASYLSVERKLNSASIHLNVSRNKGKKLLLLAPHFYTMVPHF